MAARGTSKRRIPDWYLPNEKEGLCHCGCGEKTAISQHTSRQRGSIAGQPCRYKRGHATKHKPADQHPRWKGGRIKKGSYILVRCNDDTGRRYVAEHRAVMADHLERELLSSETVHHKREKTNNNIENLELWSSSHPTGQRVSDLIEWAEELLRLYAPERLA